MIFILTFPETYGPMFCEQFLSMCCPSALLPRTHSPPHTCSHQRAAMPSTALQSIGSRKEGFVHPILRVPLEFSPCCFRRWGLLKHTSVHRNLLQRRQIRVCSPAFMVLKTLSSGQSSRYPQNLLLWCSGQLCRLCTATRCHPCSCLQAGNWRFHWKTFLFHFPSFAICLVGLSNWKNGNGRSSQVFYWSEQAELQIPCAAGGREGKSSSRSCNRSSVAKEGPVQGRREKSPKHTQISRVSLCLHRASVPNHCRQRGLWQKFKQLLGSRYLCDLCFLWPSWILCKFIQSNYYEIHKKMHIWKVWK